MSSARPMQMAFQLGWQLTAALMVIAAASAHASWTRLLTDVIPGLRRTVATPETTLNETGPTELHEYDQAVDDLLDSILAAHNLPSDSGRRRGKRSTSLDVSIKDSLGVHRLQRLSPFSDLCERQLSVSFVPYAGELYVVCVSAGSRDIRPRLTVGTLTGSKWTPVAHTDCVDPRNVVGFSFNNKLYIVAADAGLPNGAELQFFDKDTKKIYIDHTINSASPTSAAFWRMKSNGEFNLALANSGKETFTSIYNWRATYFDKYAQVESRVVCDLEPFSIHNLDFLAVVNKRFSKDTAKVSTVIYKYDLSRNTWKTLQQIPTYAATDAEFFTLGPDSSTKEFFLAIANQYEQYDDHRNYAVNSVVYKYVDGKFVPFQCLHTTGATKIAAYEGAGGEFLLAVGSLYEPVHLYQFNGWHFVLAEVQHTQSTMGPGVHDLTFHLLQPSRDLLLAVSNPSTEGPGAYKVDFYHDNQIQRWYDDSLRWCIESSQLATEESAQKLVSQLDQVYYVDKRETIRIPGEVVFQDLYVQDAIRAQQFEELASGERYRVNDLEELEKLQTELNAMKDTLRGMMTELNDALKLTGDQTLIGDYHFDHLTLDCPAHGCQLGQLETIYLNKEEVSNLPSRLFFTNAPQFPNVPMSFERLSVQSLQADGPVNGLNVSTIVTVSGNHALNGNIRFANPVHALNDVVTAGLSGVVFSPHHLLLTEGDQVQSAELTMTDATAHVLHVAGSCNGISIDKFYRNALTRHGSHVITGRKIVRDLAAEGMLQISDSGLFNNVNLHDLWHSVMWVHGHQVVTATHEYTNVQFSDVSVRGTVNGLQIPGPDVVLVNQNVTITAEKVFLADCSARELHVNVALNGIRHIPDPASDWKGQLDMLVKTPIQRITGRKTFASIHIDGHSTVGRFVDGVDLSQLAEFLRRRRTTVMNGTWTFKGKVVFEDKVTVTGLVNDRKLDDLYRYALRIDAPVFPNFKKVVFANNVQVRNLTCQDINGLHVPSSFVLRRGPKVMHGEKVFAKLRLAGEVVVKGLVNGVNLGFWKDSLLTRGNQAVRAPKVFMRNLHVKNVVVEESINGVAIADLCSLDENCLITAPKDFETLTVDGGLTANNFIVRNRINGVRAAELLQDSMLYSAHQAVSGRKIFTGNLTVPRHANVRTSNFSGVSLGELYLDAVQLKGNQVIAGEKVFSNTITSPRFEFETLLDGVSQEDMSNWMLQGVDQVISGDIVFENSLEALGPLIVRGTINEVNIQELFSKTAFKNESTMFAGPLRFEFLGSMADVHVSGTVQGIDVSEEVVDATKSVTVSGRKFMKKGFNVDGNMWVSGLVDSVKVEELCNKVFTAFGNQFVAPTTVLGDVTFHRGVKVDGLVDGVDMRELDSTCAKTHVPATLRGSKRFRNIVIEGPVILRGTLNGFNFDYLKDHYMSVSKGQIVETKLRMHAAHIHGSLHCGSVEAPLVNGLSLPSLLSSALRTVGDQTLSVPCKFHNAAFGGDVHVNGKINGLQLPLDVFTKVRTNVVSGTLTVTGNTTIAGTLTMPESARLQDVDVAAWAKIAVFNDGREYRINGAKTLRNVHTVNANVQGTVDGIKVSSSELLVTSKEQVITGKKTVLGNAAVHDLRVTGYLNGVNIHEFVHQAMLKSRNNTVTAPKRFTSGLSIATLHTTGHIGNVSLRELKQSVRSVGELQALTRQLGQHKNRINELSAAFQEQAVLLAYYEQIFVFTVGPSYSALYAPLRDSSDIFVISSPAFRHQPCGILKIFELQGPYTTALPVQEDTPVAQGSSLHLLSTQAADYIIVVNAHAPSLCSKEVPILGVHGAGYSSLEIFRWNPAAKSLNLYQVLRMDALKSVSPFNYEALGCLAVSAAGYLKIVCVHDASTGFIVHQNLPIHYSHEVSAQLCPKDGSVLMAVSAKQIGQFDRVFSYRWSRRGLQKIASIAAVSVGSVAVLGHRDACFVVVGQRSVAGADMPTSVYNYVPGHHQEMLEVQKLFAGDVQSISWLPSPDGRTTLMFVRSRGVGKNLKVYAYKGASGFLEQESLHVDESFQEVRTFQRPDGLHFVTLSNSREEPSAVILASKVKGTPYSHP
ncbi:uncharacterized protein LOC142578868 isoform X2 [Dermacentor variabilis]|uniref:uncharacterized protein LOC142578868 isoform X2 n=1 Tax=Dermacentor variabilis TaxID=34621 RepID=UPI003F5AF2DA